MWGSGNNWGREEVGNSSANPLAHCPSSYVSVMNQQLRVLVVDHESDDLMHTARQLELCDYKVSVTGLASRAMQMLSMGKVKFDFIVATINSPDLYSVDLLQQATAMSIPVISMSYDITALTAARSLANGAFLYVKKPTTMGMFEHMWQHLMKANIHMVGGNKEIPLIPPTGYINNARGIEFREVGHNNQSPNMNNVGGGPNNINIGGMNINNNNNMNNSTGRSNTFNSGTGGISNMLRVDKDKLKKDNYMAGFRGVRDVDGKYNYTFMSAGTKVKRKVCTEWTQELHEKFVAAVTELGEGRCFPKDIIETMGVPGLTRMQVASHLQKCRNDNWRSPDERKTTTTAATAAATTTTTTTTTTKATQNVPPEPSHGGTRLRRPRKFGSMPNLGPTNLTMKVTRRGTKGGPTTTTTTTGGGGGGVPRNPNPEIGLVIVDDESTESDSIFMGNMGNDNINDDNDVTIDNLVSPNNHNYHHDHDDVYGSGVLLPHSGNIIDSPDDFFNFADDGLDCLVPNYSVAASARATNNTSVDHYHFDQSTAYAQSVDSRSPETPSTLGSREEHDQSEMGGQ